MRICIALVASLTIASAALAEPGAEHWTATSSTAMAITGNITLSPKRLTMAGKTLPLAVAADVPGFVTTSNGSQPTRILSVTRPADPKLLNGNTLCGAPVRWVAVYQIGGGKSLNMAIFSSDKQPTGESDAGLCGTFLYSR